MQIIILLASLVAATAALPIPQACVVELACELLGARSDPVADLFKSGSELVERSPGAGVSTLQDVQ